MGNIQHPMNFASENIRELRRQSGMSRREVVERLADYGISLQQTSLRRIEEGTQTVKIEEALAFAEIFNISFDKFVRFPADPSRALLAMETKGHDLLLRTILIQVQNARLSRLGLKSRIEEAIETASPTSVEVQKASDLIAHTEGIDIAMQELLYAYGDSAVDYSEDDLTEEKISEILSKEETNQHGEG